MSHTIILTMVEPDGTRWLVAGELSSVMTKEHETSVTERILAKKDTGISVVDFKLLFNEEDDD